MLLDTLRTQFKASSHVEFYGTHPVTEDEAITPTDRTHMVACEIWQLTGYRFT